MAKRWENAVVLGLALFAIWTIGPVPSCFLTAGLSGLLVATCMSFPTGAAIAGLVVLFVVVVFGRPDAGEEGDGVVPTP